jgi:hypothetical protein
MSKPRLETSSRRLTPFPVLAGTLAAFLSGCSAASDPAIETRDACTLVDAAAAAAILGEPVTTNAVTPASAANNNVSLCNYETGTLHHGFMVTVGPHHLASIANDAAGRMQDNAKSAADAFPDLKVTLSDIPGLGDAAYLLTTDAYIQVYVFSSAYQVLINRTIAPTPDAVDDTEKIAALALAGLK